MQNAFDIARADRVWTFAARLLGLIMVWFGMMRFFPFGIEAMAKVLAQYAWLPPASWAPTLRVATGAVEVGIGVVLLLAPAGQWRKWAGFAAMLFWGAGLLLLVGSPAWVQDPPYAGFPVIGSGQPCSSTSASPLSGWGCSRACVTAGAADATPCTGCGWASCLCWCGSD